MNFRKTSKRPLTPPPHPIFGNYIALFATEFFGVERPPSFPLPKKRKEIFWIGKDPPLAFGSHPLSGIPKYVVLTEGRGWGVPCQEQQNCKWQTKKMQGSQAGSFRTHLKTDTKTQNTKLLHFFVSRLFILRSCIEFVNNLVTVASEMLTVTINSSKFNSVVLSLLREAIAFQIRSF